MNIPDMSFRDRAWKDRFTSRSLLSVLILSGVMFSDAANASRIQQTMGEYVQDASLIAVVDTTQKSGGYETVITFREVIRGPDDLIGRTHTLPFGNLSSGDVYVPPNLSGVAVLMKKNWKKEERPVIEVYSKADEIFALKILAKIYDIPDESSRLRALSSHFDDGNTILQQQMLHDLRHMKQPSNFHFVVEFLEIADSGNQLKIIEIMKRIGDLRGVPPLINMMNSLQAPAEIRKAAAEALLTVFAGAPGVTEALKAALDVPELREIASEYVKRIDPKNKKLLPLKSPELTNWQKADHSLKTEHKQEALDRFMAIVQDEKESSYTRLAAARKIMPFLGEAERNELRKPLLLLFETKDARDYLRDRDFVELFRALQHPDCFEPLMNLMMSDQNIDRSTVRKAVMAILELGRSAREKASDRLLEKIGQIANGKASRSFMNGTHPFFLALAWLGNSPSHEEAEELLNEGKLIEYWRPVVPLLTAADQPAEGKFLLGALKSVENLEVREWIVFRLGDLREREAVPAIIQHLSQNPGHWSYTAKESLIAIGGAEVEQSAYELLTNQAVFVRKEAVDILAILLQKNKFLPLLRRMITEENFGDKQSALFQLGQLGEPEDLKLLEPYVDYWNSDRTLHYWATSAAQSIRQRHHHDLSGAIPAKEDEEQ